MDKRGLKRGLSQSVKGASFLSRQQVERYMGWGRSKTETLLLGLDAVELNGKKKYFVDDVAERIMERMVRT